MKMQVKLILSRCARKYQMCVRPRRDWLQVDVKDIVMKGI